MNLPDTLAARSANQCELCSSATGLSVYELPHSPEQTDAKVVVCESCLQQISNQTFEAHHWRCLSDSMWSPTPAVQVLAWRILNKLNNEPWALELLDSLYLDEELSAWAKASAAFERAPTYDSNGNILNAGDTVVIIKDLDVKGTSFVAKRGTAVRNISLTDNPQHIEGRVNGTRIVILTQYVKKN